MLILNSSAELELHIPPKWLNDFKKVYTEEIPVSPITLHYATNLQKGEFIVAHI